MHVQRMERGRQARSHSRIGPPYTDLQCRQLEDALSVALDASMGLDASAGRMGYVARHLAAQDDGRAVPDAPKRTARLTAEQHDELRTLMDAVRVAVNACNCRVGSPIRNVAEHLMQQHRLWLSPKPPPQTAQERARAARLMAMRSAAPEQQLQSFVEPSRPSEAAMAAHDAAVDAAELSEGFMVEAKREATAAFAKYDADGSGAIDHEELFKVLMEVIKEQPPPASMKK